MPLVNDCVFCKIIKGEIPCSKVFENDKVLAFLDIAPFNHGHVLIVPKEHQHSVTTLDNDYLAAIMQAVPRIASAIMRETDAGGFNLLLNNGSVAGQEVPHVHLHVIPRFTDDIMLFNPAKKSYPDMKAMQDLAERISKRING